MNIYGLTDKGMVREANEDCIGIVRTKNGIYIAVVCDGMGGAAGGRVASEIAESVFMERLSAFFNTAKLGKRDSKKIKTAINDAIKSANEAVINRAREDLSLYGMGCTLCALVYVEESGKLYYANVGDSHLYMISKRSIRQLTKDHSYVQMLVDQKEITKEEAENHPQKNYITRAVGIKSDVEADISERRITTGSQVYFLLCSDGLYGLVSKEKLREVALSDKGVEEKVFDYIRLANDEGGYDNISAILLSVKEEVK